MVSAFRSALSCAREAGYEEANPAFGWIFGSCGRISRSCTNILAPQRGCSENAASADDPGGTIDATHPQWSWLTGFCFLKTVA